MLPRTALVFPVGGIRPDNMAPYWAAGAYGFGTGSNLYRPGAPADEVRTVAASFAAAFRALPRTMSAAAATKAPMVVALGEPMVEFNQSRADDPHTWLQGFGGDTSNMAIAAARLSRARAPAT